MSQVEPGQLELNDMTSLHKSLAGLEHITSEPGQLELNVVP